MKVKTYLRVGLKRRGYKIDASDTPNYAPLKAGDRFIPTVSFGVEFDIPDKLFKGASLIIGIVNVGEEGIKIAATIPVPKLKRP